MLKKIYNSQLTGGLLGWSKASKTKIKNIEVIQNDLFLEKAKNWCLLTTFV